MTTVKSSSYSLVLLPTPHRPHALDMHPSIVLRQKTLNAHYLPSFSITFFYFPLNPFFSL
jgi:hypothetical protein